MVNIADIRRDYKLAELNEQGIMSDPLQQFGRWLDEALAAQVNEPTAMTLATVDSGGRPSARIVLLKGVDHGFLFYTNYDSRKGREVKGNPAAAIVFHWPELERQVRIEGQIAKAEASLSDQYYASRPLGSRIGAWASPQSQVIASREELEQRIGQLTDELGAQPARPPFWGGYRLTPDTVEFWQGRPSRLHDRLRFTRHAGAWHIERLAP